MFDKLVKNLPFNPGLIDQVSFYARRLNQETAIRRFGFFFLAFALVVQLFAAMYPAEQSLASSPNNILNGVNNRESLLQAWDNNSGNVRAIYRKFGITRENIANVSAKADATIKSNGADYWSIGRLPLANFGVSGSQWGERKISAEGNIVYQRPLKAWDNGGSAYTYSAFKGTNQHGKTFWILKDCGNITFTGSYLPSPPTPKLELHKSLVTDNKAKVGEIVKFRLEYRNQVTDSLTSDFKLTDVLDNNFEYVSLGGITNRNGNTLVIAKSSGLVSSSNYTAQILTVKVKPGVKPGTVICNQATASTKETGSKTSEKVCVTVVEQPKPPTTEPTPSTPTPKPSPTPTPTPTPQPSEPASCYCVTTAKIISNESGKVELTTEVFIKSAQVKTYLYDTNGDGKTDFTEESSQVKHTKTLEKLAPGEHKVNVTVQFTEKSSSKKKDSVCGTSFNIREEPRVTASKTVKNVTTGVENANGTTVKPGDELEFKLLTENSTTTDYKNYIGEDYIGDVLDYAQITNLEELKSSGITLDKNNYLRWQTTVKAKTTDTKIIKVKVKQDLPVTNQPNGANTDYDCKITNRYGNELTMNVGCPLVKNIEQATKQLPNTGSGTGVAVAFVVTSVAGYFFYRSRLLAKEMNIVKSEYLSAGGI